MNIVKGRQNAPIRALAYGPEGIGKSTFAAAWPKPLFVDAEAGTLRLDVDRIQPLSWAAVLQTVDELATDCNGYKTLVFDTADWLEKLAMQAVLAKYQQDSIEAFGYGKGYTYTAEEWKRFLDQVAVLQAKTGMHVLFLGHAWMRKFEQPDEAGAYDRWETKLSKQVGPATKEWADLILFLNYKTIVVETDGKAKAQGGKRVMFAEHHPCWDAKNRFNLPAELPLTFDAIAGIFPKVAPTSIPEKPLRPEPVQTATTDDVPADLKPVPIQDRPSPEKQNLLTQLAQLMTTSSITKEQLGAELARKKVVPADMNPRDYNEATLARVVGKWAAVVNNIQLIASQVTAAA